MTIPLEPLLPAASRDPPKWRCENASAEQVSMPFLFGLAPGGVCPATPVTRHAVRSYRTISPLPTLKTIGGIFSVALSLRLPPPGIIRHLVFMEPGLSSSKDFLYQQSSNFQVNKPHCISFNFILQTS